MELKDLIPAASAWIASIATATLIGVALWLGRSLIKERLGRSIQHEFDKKIEAVRSDLRKSEEQFRADLSAKEAQLNAIQSGALSGLVSRQAALASRRLQAVDQLWSSVTKIALGKATVQFLATFNFEPTAAEAAKNPKFAEMFKSIPSLLDSKSKVDDFGDAARPFVSKMTWALFSAYRAIIMFATARLGMLRVGLDHPTLVDAKRVADLVELALPHQKEYIAKFGADAFPHLLDELESRMLDEMINTVEGREADAASLKQASAILKEAERLASESLKESQLPNETLYAPKETP